MIKRLDISAITPRRPEWPASSDDPTAGHLFSRRRPFRKIVVLVDAELWIDDASLRPRSAYSIDARTLLTALINHPLVHALRYADDGPPSTVKPLAGSHGAQVYEGWAVLQGEEPDGGVWSVIHPTEGGYSLSGVIGNAPDVAADDTKTDAYRDLAPSAAQERRRRDALAAQVASQALHADIYVTERPYLHAANWSVARGVTICRPKEAIALVSLYLRAQGEFPVGPELTFNRGLFFWVGTRELLPEAWRWFSACVQSATESGDDTMMLLGGSLLQRVDRALEVRDATHVALNHPQNHDLQEDALASLDVVLVLLMGAVDVAARVAHKALELPPEEERRAAWQDRKKGGWLTRLRVLAPTLAAVVDAETANVHALTILRLLRNSVHGAALQGMAVFKSGSPVESMIGLPARDETAILAAMRAVGGEASWGVHSSLRGRTYVDPGVLVDRLFEAIVDLLNELMAKTPVERLPAVTTSVIETDAPTPSGQSGELDPFAPWIRESIRLQLGF